MIIKLFFVCFYAKASGDLYIQATCSQISSSSVLLEDCTAYVTDFSDFDSVTNKGTVYRFSPFTLPTNHRIEFKIKSGSIIRVAIGDKTTVNSSGYLEWIYAWYTDKIYYRNSSNGELNMNTGMSTASSSYTYAIEYDGTSLTLYRNDTVLKTLTGYDPLSLTRLLRLHDTWISTVDYVKVKPI